MPDLGDFHAFNSTTKHSGSGGSGSGRFWFRLLLIGGLIELLYKLFG